MMDFGAQTKWIAQKYRITNDSTRSLINDLIEPIEPFGCRVADFMDKYVTVHLLAALVVLLMVVEFTALGKISPIEISGLFFALCFIALTKDMDTEFKSAVSCLAATNSIQLNGSRNIGSQRIFRKVRSPKQLSESLDQRLNDITERSWLWLLVSLLVFLGLSVWHVYFHFSPSVETNSAKNGDLISQNWLALLKMLGGFTIAIVAMTVGARLGRMACLGFRLIFPRKTDDIIYMVLFQPKPGHPDGKCGLKAITSFFVYQIERIFVLFLYILIWCVILKDESGRYHKIVGDFDALLIRPEETNSVYLLFMVGLLVIILLQVLGILVPILGIRKSILEKRDEWRVTTEPINHRLLELRRSIREELRLSGRDKDDILFEIEEGTKLIRDIENMGFWPISWDSMRPIMLFIVEFILVLVPIYFSS